MQVLLLLLVTVLQNLLLLCQLRHPAVLYPLHLHRVTSCPARVQTSAVLAPGLSLGWLLYCMLGGSGYMEGRD